jgi:hypothetical protein
MQAGLNFGGVTMTDYRYPGGGYWEAGSSKMEAVPLAKLIHELMNMRGVKVRSDYAGNRNLAGYAVKLDLGESVSIRFLDDSAGATLKISLFSKDKDQDIFFTIWQNLTNAGYVFDEHFTREVVELEEKKQATVNTQDDSVKKQQEQEDLEKWESYKNLPNNVSFTKRRMAQMWCEFKTAKEISEATRQPGMDYYKPASVHTEISKLRRMYKEYGIFIPTNDARRKKLIRLSIGSSN